jgi:uracil-DNA glycosylase family 4
MKMPSMTFDPRSLGAQCDRCPLKEKTPVPPQAHTSPKLIIVGMNPGRLEERQGIPFCGPSGKILDGCLEEADFDRADAHVTNAVLCRHDDDKELKRAVACCAPRLANELRGFSKEIPTLTLGAEATRAVLGKAGIMKARGFVWVAPEVKSSQVKNARRLVAKRIEGKKDPEKIEAARDSLALVESRQTYQGRTVLPSIHPAFILRGADAWLPVLRIDIKRAVRWVKGGGFPLEDFGPFARTSDPTLARKLLAKMGPLVNVDIESTNIGIFTGAKFAEPMSIEITCVGVADVGKIKRWVDGKTKTIPRNAVVLLDPWEKCLIPVLREAIRNRTVLTHNGPAFDEIGLGCRGIHFGGREDTLIAHYAFASDKPKALAFVSSIYNDSTAWKTRFKQGSEEKGVAGFGVKKEDLASYCRADVVLASLAWIRMQPDLAMERRVYEHDMKHAILCQKMQINGLLVDLDRKKELSKKLRYRSAALLGEMRELLGRRGFNPSKPNDIRKALFTQLKAPTYLAPLTPTGLPATGAAVLEALKGGHGRAATLADLIIRWRSANDSRSEYLDNLKVGADGRVHPHWRSYGTECMPAGELVLTGRGYLPVEEVHVGDLVLTHKGRGRKVTATITFSPSPIFRVTLAGGMRLRTTGNHGYLLATGEWKTADRLRPGEVAVTYGAGNEAWRPVEGWPYWVSSWGRLRGRYDRMVKFQAKSPDRNGNTYGHLKVTLKRNGARTRGPDIKDFGVHQLVLGAFGPPGEGEVRHLNGIAWDNTAWNLTWGSSKDNRADARIHGTMSHRGRSRQTKLRQTDVEYILATVGEKSSLVLAKELGVTGSLIRRVRRGERWGAEDHVVGSQVRFDTTAVISIEIDSPEPTYGLTVEEDESHVTGGVVTHNTGRPATRNPNLLNIPRVQYCPGCGSALIDRMVHKETCKPKKRKEPQPEDQLRDIYVAPPGMVWVYFDLSQCEMRGAAHLSGDANFIKACDGDVHAGNARVLFKDVPGALEDLKDPKGAGKRFRDIAKNCGFAITYLAEADKLFRHLLEHGFDVDLETCQDAIDNIRGAYHRYFEFVNENIALCRKQGYLRTAFLGRKRWLGFYPKPTEVSNFPIQAGIADIMNERLGIIDARMPRRVKQVIYQYDSAIYECPERDAETMEKLIDEVWAEPVVIPGTGRSFMQPIDRKRGTRWSDFG